MPKVSSVAGRVTLAVAVLTVPAAASLQAQEQCQCDAPGAESGRIANAIGGGLFAGLIAAVIPFHHAGALAAASALPGGSGAAAPLTTMSDSTDIAPGDSARPRTLSTYAAAPSLPGGTPPGAAPSAGASAGSPRASRASGEGSPLPLMTPDQAIAEGMLAPKTATLLPALGMIGVGLILMGIFFMRVRHPRLRSR